MTTSTEKYWRNNETVQLLAITPGLHWHPLMPGFGMRVSPKRKAVYVVRFRNSLKKDVTETVGDVADLTLEEAQKKAEAIREEGKRKASSRRKLTLAIGFEEYLNKRRTKTGEELAEATKIDYQKRYDYYLKDYGNLVLENTSVAQWVDILETVPQSMAAGTMNLVSGIYNYFWIKEQLDSNPIKRVAAMHQFRPNPKRQSKVQALDLALFLHNLEHRCRNETARDAIKVMLFAGVRRSAALQMEWAKLNPEAGCYRVAKRSRGWKKYYGSFPLSDYVLELIESRRKTTQGQGKAYVFPGRHGNLEAKPWLNEVRGTIETACTGLGYVVTPHDLRRTFATLAAMALDGDTHMVGTLMTHRWAVSSDGDEEGQITHDYIIGDLAEQRAAANQVANFILEVGIQAPMSLETQNILVKRGLDPNKVGANLELVELEDDDE